MQSCARSASIVPTLNTRAPASISQFCSFDVIVARGSQKRKRPKPIDDLMARLGTREALQQFLQHESRREDVLSGIDATNQFAHLGHGTGHVTPESHGPDAGVHEHAHRRERPAL
jgi:hypothetical protein